MPMVLLCDYYEQSYLHLKKWNGKIFFPVLDVAQIACSSDNKERKIVFDILHDSL